MQIWHVDLPTRNLRENPLKVQCLAIEEVFLPKAPESVEGKTFRRASRPAMPSPRETASKARLSTNITKEETMGKAILLCFILAASVSALAGDSKAKVRDVTGCLSKGDSANEFVLTATDGST